MGEPAGPGGLHTERLRGDLTRVWDDEITPALVEYITIPNQSPHFDPGWAAAGHMDRATALIADWMRARLPADGALEVIRLGERTPLIYAEIPAFAADTAAAPAGTVVLYGHLDKQPEMSGWDEGKGPWIPVREGDRLYGRGGADDGYAAFASLAAINAVRAQGVPHARCVLLIEACEESGSPDLPAYIEHLAGRIGSPDLVICLDSGCGNYEQLWSTTSLRGLVSGTLRVDLLREGVHSGDASGVVPSTFRIMRTLLDRIEDAATGEIRLAALHADIPAARRTQAALAGKTLADETWGKFPFIPGGQPATSGPEAAVLARTWTPALSITGQLGLPTLAEAGNVLRPFTALKLSVRLPPTVRAGAAFGALKRELERDPPYGARVTFSGEGNDGWEAPALAPWLEAATDAASRAVFGRPAQYMGEGGTIPFMAMLGDRFPQAQFLITGVLGPASNAHGPNEFLHLPYARNLTTCVGFVLAAHAQR